MPSEFDLIRRHAPPGATRADVLLGSGDDAALLEVPTGKALVATVDTLIAGRHFPANTTAFDIGWKALAVNLSDLAAMGADAAWATVALTMPAEEPETDAWMGDFAAGIQALAEQQGVAIVGGDLTAGPLSVTIQALGVVDPARSLRRDAAREGDLIAVTGTLGDAALALRLLRAGELVPEALQTRLNRPQPRLEQGRALAGVARAAIDISDGLLADLGHVLAASDVGARIDTMQLPMSDDFRRLCPADEQLHMALTGGDDYELCVCLPREAGAIEGLTVIGEITQSKGLQLMDSDGHELKMDREGYDHFQSRLQETA